MVVYDISRPRLDLESRSYRYYRNAVERHWDPAGIDLAADEDHLREAAVSDEVFTALRTGLARFGAGERAVTEDLAPLAVVLEDTEEQLFLATQLYEEAKHTGFFDRYWREVIRPVEAARGDASSAPTGDRWFNAEYVELFERNRRAVSQLLHEDTPERRAEAYCHYHLTIEGILAQTGYYGMQRSYSADTHPELPHLPGLVEGFRHIRSDEGRHVGFGMAKLEDLVGRGAVDPADLDDTVGELLPLVNAIVADEQLRTEVGIEPEELESYATEKHLERMRQITDAAREIPDVESLVRLDDSRRERS